MSKPMKKEMEVSEKEIEVSEQSHTFIERGLPYLVLQFALFGLIIGVNQLTLRWGVECGWWCNFFPLAVQIICGVFFGIFGAIIWAWGMSTLGDNLTMFPMPMDGSPLEHPALAQALAKQTQFTGQEWAAFGISKLRMDHFIVSGNSCFRPANPRRSCPSLWAAFLVNGA